MSTPSLVPPLTPGLPLSVTQGEFPADLVWAALLALLTAQMPGVDVQPVSEKDFDPSGDLILNPPSVRIYFAEEVKYSESDLQRLSYDTVTRFVVSCADSNLYSVASQALASAALASTAQHLLAGARIVLPNGDLSAPVAIVSTSPLPVKGLGMAYAVAIEVSGIAQFPGTNAAGFVAPQGGF